MSLRSHYSALIFVLALALGLRLWQLDKIPPGFHFDEAFEGLEALRILDDASYRPLFLSGNFGVPALNAYVSALTFGLVRLMGGEAGPVAMRSTSALVGALTVLAIYLLAQELRRLTGRGPTLSAAFPLFAATMLAVMRWHIHFSRMAIEPIFVPLLWTLVTWLVLRGWRTGRWQAFALGGVLTAAAMYTYQGAWVIPFLAGIQVGLLALSSRPKSNQDALLMPTRRRGVMIAFVFAAVLFAPLAWYFWQHPDQLLLRPTQIAVIGGAATPSTSSIWANLWATAAMFGPLGAVGDLDPRRNLPGAPALNVWLAPPFFLGLALSLWRLRWPAFALLLSALIGLLLPGIFSEYAPHFHRILGAAAPVALLGGVGLDWLWQSGERLAHARLRRRALRWLSILLLVGGGLTSTYNYFVRWATLPELFYAFDEGLWQIGRALAALPPADPLYLTPRPADHPTMAFARQIQPGGAPAPVSFDGRHIFPLSAGVNPQTERYVVIEQEDFRTRLLLPEVFPAAQIEREIVDWQGQPYAHFYTRPVQTTPQRPPQVTLTATLGDGIGLVGYDVQPATLHAGEVLYLQLHWLVEASPSHDWVVFTHVVATDSNAVLTGSDSQPGAGALPTTRWQAGWRILDEYQIILPAEMAPGSYGLEIGLYQTTGERLPPSETGLFLGEIEVE